MDKLKIRAIGYLYLLITFCCLLASAGSTAEIEDTVTGLSGPLIDSIHIENGEIFAEDSSKYDLWIFQLANRLHIKTKKYVIRRELLLKEGDPFSRRLADETERNLRALPFLWDARVNLRQSPKGKNVLEVSTADSWTLLGGISISRTAGETVYHIRGEEQNLLGTGQYLSLHYYIRDTLEDYAQFTFLERRLFSSRFYFQVCRDGNPEIGMTSLTLGKPFYSLDTRFSARFSYIDWDRREDYYDRGIIIAQDKTQGQQLSMYGGYRFGSYNDKLQIGAEIFYKDISIVEKKASVSHPDFPFPEDSLYYAVIPELSIHNYQYVQTTHIDKFRRVEDILLLNGARLRFGRAFNDDNGKIYDLAELRINYAKFFKNNLLLLEITRNYWLNGSRDFRNKANISIRYYNNGISWLTPMLGIRYDEDLREGNVASLYLGENNGLRGYPKNYSTGEKRIAGNIECRIFPGINILSADLGAVQFFDFGKSWKYDSNLRFRDLLWSVGIGLRIGVERVSSAKMMRFDLAYAGKLKDWQISFGLGQYVK